MRKIDGDGRTVSQLLSKQKYAIDYYQREYKWGHKQVTELLQDLAVQFLEDYDETKGREEIENYGHYFLGSVIISSKEGRKFIVDGQQRLTTLTLLLIYLNNLQQDRKDIVHITDLIFSEKYGKKSFNMDVEERIRCMDALFNQETFDDTDQPESVRNIVARYHDIEEQFPDELEEDTLPFFLDWLLENVHLVEITAYTDEDAYTIFETMNDRGLSLSPSDMLKGYLLANINGDAKRWEIHSIWKRTMSELVEIDSDETADFFKAWLRSQYADKIRERKRGASPKDFDRIGTEFHRWVREKREKLELKTSNDFVQFIEKDMVFYARQYKQVREASLELMSPLEDVLYIAQFGFTLQYPLLLAPLKTTDTEELIIQKIRIVAAYIDILLARRLWNWRSISYSTMQYAMFLVMREIRSKSPEELVQVLETRLAEMQEQFSANDRFSLHGQNRVHVHRLLARMTSFIERRSGMPSHYEEYMGGTGRSRYEVEHIWANHPEWHDDEFSHPQDFSDYRNRIGGLLLLPKTFNASYGDLTYEDKLPHYFGQNLLAKSMHPKCYEHNRGFLDFIEESGLSFQPHSQFKQADLDTRQSLYKQLANLVWSPTRLEEALR